MTMVKKSMELVKKKSPDLSEKSMRRRDSALLPAPRLLAKTCVCSGLSETRDLSSQLSNLGR